jgi:CBS-domain-containing membrane protein
VHPPAAACALLYISSDVESPQKTLGWEFLVPAFLGSIIMVLVALVVNNAFKIRSYPLFW